jgi:hypothetical protein
MHLVNYKLRIIDLAQRWRMDLITESERNELETWFRSLEDHSLGVPTEMSVDEVERRLYQLTSEPYKKIDGGPPYPL